VHANKCLLAASLLPSSVKAHASSSAPDQERVTIITDSSQEQQQLVEETRPTHEVINIDDSQSPPRKRATAALPQKIENFFKRQVP
jgi:hypothetical protein